MRVFFFLIVLFVIAVALRIDFFFTIFYLFVLVYALSHIWMQSTARRLSVRRRFDSHAFTGDQVTVELDVHNEGWLPLPWLEAHESLPVQLATPPFHRQVFSLGARAKRRLTYRLHCEQRGYYVIGPMTVRAGDLLGLVRPRLERAEPAHLIVYPRVVPLDQLALPTRSPLVALPARSPLFEDPARVMGVREYQRGDSPRRIHWPASAKATAAAAAGTVTANRMSPSTGDADRPRRQGGAMHLMVKRYQPAIARETLICLDLYQEDYGQRQRYTATELAIVVAASLANHIIVREGLPVGLLTEAQDPLAVLNERSEDVGAHILRDVRLTPDLASGLTPASARGAGERLASLAARSVSRFSLPPRTGRGQLMSLLEVLARVQTIPDGVAASGALSPFANLLRHARASLSWGATITIITGRETTSLLDALFHLRRAGYAVALILVQPGMPSKSLRDRTERLSVPIYRVWQEQDLQSMVGEAGGSQSVSARAISARAASATRQRQ
jgi:uncharacterized protein (DUF58 family)